MSRRRASAEGLVVGATVRDVSAKDQKGHPRVGRVVGLEEAAVRLRPFSEGPEWTAEPEDLVPCALSDALRPAVAEANARGRRNVLPSLVDLGLSANTDPGAPRVIYSAICMMCPASSKPVDNEWIPVAVWMRTHTLLNPEHRDFKTMTESFWRADARPGGDQNRPFDAPVPRDE